MSENYGAVARRILADPSLVSTSELPELPGYNPPLEEIEVYRPELYALLAIAVNKVVSDSIEDAVNYPPLGLSDGLGSVRTLRGEMSALQLNLNLTLQAQKRHTLDAMRDSDLSPVVSRLDDLVGLFDQVVPDTERYESTAELLGGGVSTASKITVGSLAVISRLMQQTYPGATNEQIAEVAARSVILPRRVASINLDHLPYATDIVRTTGSSTPSPLGIRIDPIALKRNTSGEEYVDFTQPIKDIAIPNRGNQTIGESVECDFETLTCPAMANIDGIPAVNKLWAWAVNLATYSELFIDPEC